MDITVLELTIIFILGLALAIVSALYAYRVGQIRELNARLYRFEAHAQAMLQLSRSQYFEEPVQTQRSYNAVPRQLDSYIAENGGYDQPRPSYPRNGRSLIEWFVFLCAMAFIMLAVLMNLH
jgi:hypothetical protein